MRNCTLAVLCVIGILVSQNAMSELRAGVAKAEVTPPIGGPMYGYGARGSNVSQGVHDPLYAKVLILDDGTAKLAIVTLDLGAFSRENTDNVRAIVAKKTDITNILCLASHTHSAPRATDDFPSKEEPWIREAEQKIADAIIEAASKLAPVSLSVGWGEVREGHNRRLILTDGTVHMFWGNRERLPTAPVDYELGVIRVTRENGKTLATLVNFTCHPVVLGPENLEISADYPGVFTRLVEEGGGGQCMFLQGAAGNINPFWDKTPPEDGAFEQVAIMGTAVAKEVLRVSSEMSTTVADTTISVHREVIALAERRDKYRESREVLAEINTILIGDQIAIATFPGEFFVEHGLSLKGRSKFPHTFFLGYCNDALGYFPTIQACTEGGYGAASATRVEVGAGERLVNRALVNLYYQADRIHP